MNTDDIVYLSLLFFSIAFGHYYRTIPDQKLKRNVGTAVGLALIVIVSGFHIIHCFVLLLVNTCIIFFYKKKCHVVSFVFSFLYLLFFRTTVYFGLPYPPAHTNLVQMMLTLKLVGLALEINTYHEDSSKKRELYLEDITFVDILHYAFNYVGVLTGPYYRYRTFWDYFNQPWSQKVDSQTATLDKLKYVPLFAGLFILSSYCWPISYATSDEFYERSWLYRYWYIWPTFFIFRMRIYSGLVLSECVCTMAGLGAYPKVFTNKPGLGPECYGEADSNNVEYDFETIHNINPYGADFCTTFREAMKHWNICIQYWLAVNVYKRFPVKKYRTVVTLLVSSFWHGVYLGYYVCIGTVPFVLALEDVYYKLFLKDQKRVVYPWIHWIWKMHFFSYEGIAFLLLHVGAIFHYYNSVYHAGVVIGVVMYVIGLSLLKKRRIDANAEGDKVK